MRTVFTPVRHVFFALFDRSEPAVHALREIREARHDYPGAALEVALHRGAVDDEKLPIYSTNGRRRLIFGAINGVFWGAVVGVLLFVSGIAPASLGILLGFTALMGAAIGGLGGFLTGVSSPDAALERITHDMSGNEIAISFATSDDDFYARAQNIFAENGARLEQRHAV
jgi:uncharacterized membrane protein